MAAGQFCLFDPPKPLVERLDGDFFRTIPSGPGVYLICGATGGVLYVGKARRYPPACQFDLRTDTDGRD